MNHITLCVALTSCCFALSHQAEARKPRRPVPKPPVSVPVAWPLIDPSQFNVTELRLETPKTSSELLAIRAVIGFDPKQTHCVARAVRNDPSDPFVSRRSFDIQATGDPTATIRVGVRADMWTVQVNRIWLPATDTFLGFALPEPTTIGPAGISFGSPFAWDWAKGSGFSDHYAIGIHFYAHQRGLPVNLAALVKERLLGDDIKPDPNDDWWHIYHVHQSWFATDMPPNFLHRRKNTSEAFPCVGTI